MNTEEISAEMAAAEVMLVGHRFVKMLRLAAEAPWAVRVDGRVALMAVAGMLEQATEEVTI